LETYGQARHSDAELEALLRSLERQGWVIEKGKKYYKAWCPPPHKQCLKTVKLTPSNPNYSQPARTVQAVRLLEGGAVMRSYYVEVTCQASQTAATLEERLDEVMDALLEEPGIEDADVGADLGTGVVDFCIHLDAEDSPDALRRVHVLVRSAFHAAGGGTPG
jgi:hypothetical protein